MISYSHFRPAASLLVLLVGSIQIFAQNAGPAAEPSREWPSALFSGRKIADQGTVPVTEQQNTTLPNKQSIVPLTSREKLAYGARKAFLGPGAYLSPAVDAFFIERGDVKAPGKTSGDKFADGLSYYARSFTTGSTAALLGDGVYPALFKQDPRYHPSGKHGFMARTLYAASRAVVTLGDNGKTQINVSKLAGNFTSRALANVYERDTVKARDANGRALSFRRRVGVRPTFVGFGISTVLDAATNIAFREFDVVGKLLKILHP